MGLFNSKEEKQAAFTALNAEVERLDSAPLPDLAEELLTRAWGEGGPGDSYARPLEEISLDFGEITQIFTGVDLILMPVRDQAVMVSQVIGEALQLLEHSRLIMFRVAGSDLVQAKYRPTRAGLAALKSRDVRAHLVA